MSNQKYYFIDNGFLSLFLFDPETSLLENLVAIHLHEKYGEDLFYYHNNVEVDFVSLSINVLSKCRIVSRMLLLVSENWGL